MTTQTPLDMKITLLDEKNQQHLLINRFINKLKSKKQDVSKYVAHAKKLEATIDILEYDIRIGLGDDEDELVYWKEQNTDLFNCYDDELNSFLLRSRLKPETGGFNETIKSDFLSFVKDEKLDELLKEYKDQFGRGEN